MPYAYLSVHSDGRGRLQHREKKYVVAVGKNQVSLKTRHKTQSCLTSKTCKVGTYYDPSFGESTHEASISKTPHGFRSTAPALIVAMVVRTTTTNDRKTRRSIKIISHVFI